MKLQHSKHDLFVLGPPSTCPVFVAGGRYSCDEHHMYPSLWIVTNTCVFGIAAVVALPHTHPSTKHQAQGQGAPPDLSRLVGINYFHAVDPAAVLLGALKCHVRGFCPNHVRWTCIVYAHPNSADVP
jgi:hypothetical protein